MKRKAIILMLMLGGMSGSCVAVQPYEKVYLNDDEMQLGVHSAEKFEITFQLYREGASGANGGKTGGGCGCN